MRWAGKIAAKHVLDMLARSHNTSDPEEKYTELCAANRAGEQHLWWYKILKSHCKDYSDGQIVGYDDPIGDQGLQGFDEENRHFFKKADIQYLGRAPCKHDAVTALEPNA